MVAYAVFLRERVRRPETMRVYFDEVAATFEGHPMIRRVNHGVLDMLEGAAIESVVIVEFPDTAAARAWYDSPAYEAVRRNRFLSADYTAFIVDGV